MGQLSNQSQEREVNMVAKEKFTVCSSREQAQERQEICREYYDRSHVAFHNRVQCNQ